MYDELVTIFHICMRISTNSTHVRLIGYNFSHMLEKLVPSYTCKMNWLKLFTHVRGNGTILHM